MVGIAGGADKCDYVVRELGFDACVDYKAGGVLDALRAACPDGVDVYFENVGGEVLDALLRVMNLRAQDRRLRPDRRVQRDGALPLQERCARCSSIASGCRA